MYPGVNMSDHQDLILSCTDELIESVNETRQISKALLSQGLLTEDKYRTIAAASSSRDRMKQLLHALANKGQQGRQALYRLLQEHEPELTLQLEQALYVHAVRQKLIQLVRQVEPVANRMLTQGLITEEEYFQVCEEEGSEARMHVMFRVLEHHGMKQSGGFYSALFHCEALLYRELEKDRVLQMCELDRECNQLVNLVHMDNLEERWRELESKEKQVKKEREELSREWDNLKTRQAELDQERKHVVEMKHELKNIQRKWDKMKEDMDSHFFSETDEQRMTGQWEHLNNNSYPMPLRANSNLFN